MIAHSGWKEPLIKYHLGMFQARERLQKVGVGMWRKRHQCGMAKYRLVFAAGAQVPALRPWAVDGEDLVSQLAVCGFSSAGTSGCLTSSRSGVRSPQSAPGAEV